MNLSDFFGSDTKEKETVKTVTLVIDLSNILFRAIFSDKHIKKAEDVSIDLLRHLTLASVLDYIKKCKTAWSEHKVRVVLALDGHSWRYDVFPEYKWARKQKDPNETEEQRKFSEKIKETFAQLCSEAEQYFPYVSVKAAKAEADDVCAYFSTLATPEAPVVVVSGDKDIHQLAYGSVSAIVPTQTGKKWFSFATEAERDFYVFSKIASGDGGDGIPNCLSPKNSFVEKVRQKPLHDSRVNKWWNGGCSNSFGEIVKLEPPEVTDRFFENQDLIDLRGCRFIPAEVIDGIKKTIESSSEGLANRELNLYKYFATHNLSRHLSNISLFLGG